MSRPLSFLLAGALVASLSLSAAPAVAGDRYISDRGNNWGHDGRDGWRGNDDWRWGHRRHHRRDNFRPGFSFSFGVPFTHTYSYYAPRQRDCYRDRFGRLYCRAY